MSNCIFCAIVAGKAPAHRIWESETHLAFLSIFPNTKGFSVVIPKQHYASYIFDLPEPVMTDLVRASKEVAKLLDRKLPDVGRTGMIFERFGVDHIHAKLFPMHGTKMEGWKPLKSNVDKYFDKYEGYISSHDYQRANDTELAALARLLREWLKRRIETIVVTRPPLTPFGWQAGRRSSWVPLVPSGHRGTRCIGTRPTQAGRYFVPMQPISLLRRR